MICSELHTGWLYESIVTCKGDPGPRAAPFGVRILDRDHISLDLFKGGRTLAALTAAGEFAVNLPPDPLPLFQALYQGERLAFEPARTIDAVVLEKCPLVLEAQTLSTRESEHQVQILARVILCRKRGNPVPLNRAGALVMESLVLSTRKHLMPRENFQKTLMEHLRVVKKVAPGSVHEQTLTELTAACL